MRIRLLIALLSFSLWSVAQESPRISTSFQDVPLNQAVSQLELESGYRFFYLPEWFGNTRITAEFVDTPLPEVLDKLFEQTLINYLITEGQRIILTQNNIVVDALPPGFFWAVRPGRRGN